MHQALSSRAFQPGTTGWSVDDLRDPSFRRQWEQGAFEIVEGVLTTMPPAYGDSSLALGRLIRAIDRWLEKADFEGDFALEVDIVISEQRVARADAALLTPDEQQRQRELNADVGDPNLIFGRLLIPPTLVIESLSPGHETHDRDTKRRWYAEFGVPNYWLLDAYRRTLDCLVLEGDAYRTDAAGKEKDVLSPSCFEGCSIALARLWG